VTNGSKKIGGPPEGHLANKISMVAAALEIAGGATAMARLCGVRRQSIYLWIKEWKVERLVDALKLSRASGIPIEKFAGALVTRNVSRKKNRHVSAGSFLFSASRVLNDEDAFRPLWARSARE
jgi:transposase-like protein